MPLQITVDRYTETAFPIFIELNSTEATSPKAQGRNGLCIRMPYHLVSVVWDTKGYRIHQFLADDWTTCAGIKSCHCKLAALWLLHMYFLVNLR